MNFNLFAAIVRMRWRMMRNQFGKSGRVNQIATIGLLLIAALCSVGSFVVAVGWGKVLLAKLEPMYVMYVWDVLAGAFLFAWSIALMVELQRSEMLSLKNLLHLPISLRGAFYLNYASSFASLTLLLFLPAMLGLCLASMMQFGGNSLVAFALLFSFLLMVTAVSYLLRGLLARLMENKRTRGTVIAVTTIVFIMIFQIPNFINMGTMGSRIEDRHELYDELELQFEELKKLHDAGTLSGEDYIAANEKLQAGFDKKREAVEQAQMESLNRTATIVNLALPIGWLPYGAGAAAKGEFVAPWLCALGMACIGLVSLAFAYRSTLRAYTGEHNKVYRPVVRKQGKVLAAGSLLEKNIPFLTETQSVMTLATLRSTLRAPEAKLALLTPLIFAGIFGSMIVTGKMDDLPNFLRPWIGVGALGVSLMGMLQLMLNIFGLDRQGFRAYVLMPAPRKDILLGKNLGIFPIAGTLGALLILFLGIVGGGEFSHVVATLLQIVIAYAIYFTIGNFTSIVAPIGMAIGTMKPVSMKFSIVLIQFGAMLLIPVALIPAFLALLVEMLAGGADRFSGLPIYLLLTLIELPLALGFYYVMLKLEGGLLQEREQTILETISQVAE